MSYAIYLRKSRADAEAEARGEGETLARHQNILLSLARKLNLEITGIYKELVSGETISARPVMQKLLEEVGQGLWDGVVVMELERLGRGDTIDQGIISQAFKFTDTKIITPAKTYDPNNEFDEEYFEFGLFMSRREYKTIRRRMAKGREAAVKEGKYIGTYPPYGYNKIWRGKICTLEINQEQSDIVRLIFEWYTKGELNINNSYVRLGYNSIANKLNDMGIVSMRNKKWLPCMIRNMLKNPVYIGKLRWNYTKEVKRIINGNVVKMACKAKEGEYILADGVHEAIIDMDTWNKTQEYIRTIPTVPAPLSKGVKNPFAGLIVCGVCGKKMVRKPNTRVSDSLLCITHNCPNKSVYFNVLEVHILEDLRELLRELKLEYKLRGNMENDNDIPSKERIINVLGKESKTLKEQLDNAYNLLERGIYDVDVFLERSGKLKEKIRAIEDNITLLQSEIDSSNSRRDNNIIPKVEYILQAYNRIKDNGTKNVLLKEVLDRIVYYREKTKNRVDNEFKINIYPKV